MRRLFKFFLYCFAFLGFAVTGLLLLAGYAAYTHTQQPEDSRPESFALFLDLSTPLIDENSGDAFAGLANDHRAPSLLEATRAIKRAAQDPDVTGLAAIIGAPDSLARVQELRAALQHMKEAGKPTIAFAEDLSMSGPPAVLLASAFDEVWLQPSGGLDFSGYRAEAPFIREALASIGIEALFSQRKEYKTAPETFVRDGFSPEARETLQSLLGAWVEQTLQGISLSRTLPTAQLETAMARSPLLAREAQEAGLVDRLGYWDEFYDQANETLGQVKWFEPQHYLAFSRPSQDAVQIALIHITGPIMRGGADQSLSGSRQLGSDAIREALEEAAEDDSVAAIVLRIDSPGGDYVAADAIWRAVTKAKEKKPVVASLGSVAASGGYYAAMGADKIVAQPGALVGSIGVFSGKFVLGGMWEKVGVSWESVSAGGPGLGMFSPNEGFTPEQSARFESLLDAIYDDFTSKAAQSRSLSPEDIDRVARGRVFTGFESVSNGLTDALGGLDKALETAAEAAGEGGSPIAVALFPPVKPLPERIIEWLAGEDDAPFGLLSRLAQLDALLHQLTASPLVQTLSDPRQADPRRNALQRPH